MVKYAAVAFSILMITACSPRYGHDPQEVDLVPMHLGVGNLDDYRYHPPTKSYIPENLPAGVLKQNRRPPYYKAYDSYHHGSNDRNWQYKGP